MTGGSGFVGSHLVRRPLERGRCPWDLRLPRTRLPHWPVRVLGPAFGLTQDCVRKHLGIRFRVDNSRSVRELGLT
ncbi:hypothetical protein ACF073_10215 [Streptomyces sp. NPDC015171]|uniref:hypothetical protein n=1 Tax=Streptomyces sp. NPDC015171 TaxID=3364945 RepID=UPI0036FBEE57